MSKEERNELESLFVWLKTFPQIEQFLGNKENAGPNNAVVLGDPNLARYDKGWLLELFCDSCGRLTHQSSFTATFSK
jgi:hypothetical protein